MCLVQRGTLQLAGALGPNPYSLRPWEFPQYSNDVLLDSTGLSSSFCCDDSFRLKRKHRALQAFFKEKNSHFLHFFSWWAEKLQTFNKHHPLFFSLHLQAHRQPASAEFTLLFSPHLTKGIIYQNNIYCQFRNNKNCGYLILNKFTYHIFWLK